jgi:hypothetical protein
MHLLAIEPSNGDRWTFALLAIFLDEQSHLWSLQDSTRLYTPSSGPSYYGIICTRGGIIPGSFIIKLYLYQVKGSFKIRVEAQRKWLSDDWRRTEIMQLTQLARGGTTREKAKIRHSFGSHGMRQSSMS